MKKSSFLLSLILFLCLAFITSCSSIFDSNGSGATVSFRLNQDAVNALASKVSSSRATLPAELENTMLSVTLYVNNKPLTQETPLTEEGAFISFPNIIVGSKVSALVKVLKNGELLAAGNSGEAVRVKKGENLLSVTLRYAADGQIFFGDHVTIQLVASNASNEVWLNKGEWTIKLLDASGNDILSDVDWGNAEYNDYILHVVPSVRKGHTNLFGESDSLTYFSINGNKLSMAQDWPLPQSGDMELTLTVMPSSEIYMNKAGKLVPFPQFEPASTTVEINVTDNLCFDVTGINYFDSNGSGYNSVLHDKLASLSKDTLIKLYGTTDASFDDVFGFLKAGIPSGISVDDEEIPYEVSLDFSGLETTYAYKMTSSWCSQDYYNLVSVILPDTLEDYGKGTFQNCTHLRNIVFGPGVKYIGEQAFPGCRALTSLTIPKNVVGFGEGAFYDCENLTELNFEDTSGKWYAIDDSTLDNQSTFNNWLGGETPSEEYAIENVDAGEGYNPKYDNTKSLIWNILNILKYPTDTGNHTIGYMLYCKYE